MTRQRSRCRAEVSLFPLELKSPERGIGLDEFQADVPGLVIAPDHFGFGFAAGFRVDQADTAVKRDVGTYHSHAAGMADVNGDGVGELGGRALVPFDKQFDFGNDALVTAKLRPTFLQGGRDRICQGANCHV